MNKINLQKMISKNHCAIKQCKIVYIFLIQFKSQIFVSRFPKSQNVVYCCSNSILNAIFSMYSQICWTHYINLDLFFPLSFMSLFILGFLGQNVLLGNSNMAFRWQTAKHIPLSLPCVPSYLHISLCTLQIQPT